MSDYRSCSVCGAAFKKSRNDYTRRCPSCRSAARGSSARSVQPRIAPKVVSSTGRTCTVRTSTGPCGAPAVYAFVSSTGEIFSECDRHYG